LVHEELRRRAADVAGFVATSRFYADYMAGVLDVPIDRMHVVHLGVDVDGFRAREEHETHGPFVIGYLARICPEKGLHLLVDAVKNLVDAVGRERVRLRIAGYLGDADRSYLDGILEQLDAWKIRDLVDHVGELDRAQKVEFLTSLDVLSVPTIYHEPKGLFVLEALASAVPVIQPRHGAFPEILEDTRGGVLVEPESVGALAAALRELMEDPRGRREIGLRGRRAVRERYDDATMADGTLSVYRRYAARTPAAEG
jgi:glycosyltransferase involved in cell wall biosynthesis